MNFNWNNDIYNDDYPRRSSGQRPVNGKVPSEFVLPWGFKILGGAIAFFPVLYKLDQFYIHSSLFSKVFLSDSILILIIMIGLAIEAKSESKKYIEETSDRRFVALIVIAITAFVYFHSYIPKLWDEIF